MGEDQNETKEKEKLLSALILCLGNCLDYQQFITLKEGRMSLWVFS